MSFWLILEPLFPDHASKPGREYMLLRFARTRDAMWLKRISWQRTRVERDVRVCGNIGWLTLWSGPQAVVGPACIVQLVINYLERPPTSRQ